MTQRMARERSPSKGSNDEGLLSTRSLQFFLLISQYLQLQGQHHEQHEQPPPARNSRQNDFGLSASTF